MNKVISIPVVILKTKNCYNAFSPLIEGCVVTDKTIDRTLSRMRKALEFHLEGELLLKHRKRLDSNKILKETFKDYGTDAFYASLKIAA